MSVRSLWSGASVSNWDWPNQQWVLNLCILYDEGKTEHCIVGCPSTPSPWLAPSGGGGGGGGSSAFGIKDYSGLRGVNRGPFVCSHASGPFPIIKDFNEISYSCYIAWTTENISVWSMKLNMACLPWEIMLISRNTKYPAACLACKNGESRTWRISDRGMLRTNSLWDHKWNFVKLILL